MRTTTVAVVVAIAIVLSAVSVVSAMGIYDTNKRTEADGTTPSNMSDECQKLMEAHGNMSMDQCMRMLEDDNGSQMEQCSGMMQTCMQMMNGTESSQTANSGMGSMMNDGGMGMSCH